jgi:peroxidase
MDLVALNIQRGRDHGLAPYMAWRQLCGLPTANSWKELAMLFNSMVVARLQALYETVEDIDVFVGGILEVRSIYGEKKPQNRQRYCLSIKSFS